MCIHNARVFFLGHVLDTSGIRSDPEKVKAIQTLKEPSNTPEVGQVVGMTTSHLVDTANPLRELIS